MRRLRGWISRLAGVFGGSRRERELDEELASHIELHTEDNIRSGLPPDEARRLALAKLGTVQSVKRRHRDQGGIPAIEEARQDLREAARTFQRAPGFATIAVLTIALGVAGPTLMFAMAKQWILDPLPFQDAEKLIDLRNLDPTTGNTGPVNPADFLDWQRETGVFDELAAYRLSDVRVTGGERPERARGAQVTPNFFGLLGVHAASGRVFDPADGQTPDGKVAVISDAMWRRRFSSDEAIVGQTIRIENEDHTIVGVLPVDFQFTLLGAIDVWQPMVFSPDESTNRRPRTIGGLGRLRDDRRIEDARAELKGIADRLAAAFPETNSRRQVRVWRLADEVRLHHDAGILVPVLFAMMCCVLLVACVNVAHVMFARATSRRREMALRLALGASRARVMRQWLVEHIVLFILASLVGAALAAAGAAWVTHSIPPENRQFLRNNAVIVLDRTALAFALAVGVVCALLSGWLPSWANTRADVNVDLHDASTRATTSKVGARVRAALVASEVALTLALLIGAGFLMATARNVTHVNVGFDPHHLLTFGLSLDQSQYREPDDIRGFYDRLTSELSRLPGVSGAAVATLVPFGTEGSSTDVFIEGQPDPTAAETPSAAFSVVSGDYASTLGLRLRSGRRLTGADGASAPRVAMINETFAARHFAGLDPIGQRVRLRRDSTDLWQIVGVVADVKNYESVEQQRPQIYIPFAQSPRRSATVVIRSASAPESLIAAARSSVAAIDSAEPLADVATMDERIARVTAPYVTVSSFVALFGAVTLLLAGVGVYGIISYTFALRTREIGVRMALGASRVDVGGLVLQQVRTFLLAGIIPGIALAWLLGQAMQGFLFGVSATDWTMYLTMSALLTVVILGAVLVPARRAVGIDPTVALRCE
jgi:predicted permease